MSQANVDLVLAIFEASNRRDFKAAMAPHTDDVELRFRGDTWFSVAPEGAVVGKRAVGEWFLDWFAQFDDDYRFEIGEVRDWGDRVFLTATHHGRGRESGVPMAHESAWVYTLRDGRVVRFDAYSDVDEALAARNVDVVVGLFENTNKRDFKAVMDAYADDVVLTFRGETWGMEKENETVGKQAVGAWFGDWFATFDRDYRFEIDDVRDWGDRVYIAATHHSRGRESGVPAVQTTAWVYTLRDGAIVRCEAYLDPAEALAREREE